MHSFSIEELPWLLRAPDDVRAQIGALRANPSAIEAGQLQRLASYGLGEVHLHGLSRVLDQPGIPAEALCGLSPLRVAVVGSSNTQMVVPALRASGLRHGLLLDVHEAEFGQVVQEAVDPSSEISRSGAEVVVVLLDQSILPQRSFGDAETERDEVEAVAGQVHTALRGFAENAGAPVVISTIPDAGLRPAGSLERSIPGTASRCIARVNEAIRDMTAEGPHCLFELAGLAESIGLARWMDPGQWFTARLPFDQAFIPIVSDSLARVLAAMRGKSRKVLALDLDHTLWGGVIGDDGLAGIRVAQGDPVGEAHLALQRLALRYKQQGIVLAVVSKNDEETARRPFLDLEGMAMQLDDIAVFVANWDDKASNLRFVAETLNVGTDSLVFVDDNPAERELVRQCLPEVAVPELPANPAVYAPLLSSAGYFEAVSFTPEDGRRTEMYQANRARQEALSRTGNLGDFLASLEMEMAFEEVPHHNINRVTQLINKTNQFNLTTRRYSEAEVGRMIEDERVFPFQVRLADRFGDNGTISVIICRSREDGTWQIDTWLMSCRVLKRQVEDACLDQLVARAKERSVTALRGSFIPTGRNGMVERFFPSMGFEPASHPDEADGTAWILKVEDHQPRSHFIKTLSN